MHKIREKFDTELQKKYEKRFLKYGATPEGSYWLNSSRQNLRFKILLQEATKLQKQQRFSVGDIGCGYGALAQYISKNMSSRDIKYYGYDISTKLINYCQNSQHPRWADFRIGSKPHIDVDICLISGTYNLSATRNVAQWEDYIFKNLSDCWCKTKTAIIFNLQISHRAQVSSGNIFYGDKSIILKRCNIEFGPTLFVDHESLPHDTTFVVQSR